MGTDISDIANGRTPTEVRTILTGYRAPITRRREQELRENRLPPIQKASALIEESIPLPPELIEGLLYRGSTMIFGGGSKTNKTFGMMDLAISVAAGLPWWGFNTTKGPVLYLDFELQKTFFRRRLNHIADRKGVTIESLEDLEVWNLRGHATDLSAIVDEIIERISAKSYSLIIIDPIYKVLGERDENSAGDINSLMNELDRIAVASGAAIVVGHHFSKGNQAGKESMDRISGSGVFARSPDAILIITPHEEQDVYTVETTLRNHRRIDPFCIRFDHPLMVRCEEKNPTKLKVAGRKKEEYPADLLLVPLQEGALTTTEWKRKVMASTGMGDGTFNGKKSKLEEAGKIVKNPEGKWRIALPQRLLLNPDSNKEVQSATSAIAPVAA